eukprot:13481552-Alexandrium_andersonii.AAC.1
MSADQSDATIHQMRQIAPRRVQREADSFSQRCELPWPGWPSTGAGLFARPLARSRRAVGNCQINMTNCDV